MQKKSIKKIQKILKEIDGDFPRNYGVTEAQNTSQESDFDEADSFGELFSSDFYEIKPEWYYFFQELQKNPNAPNKESVKILMEHFCYCVKNREEVPLEILRFFASCFYRYSVRGHTLEAAFRFKRFKRGAPSKKNNELPASDVQEVAQLMIFEGKTRYKACVSVASSRNMAESTVRDHATPEALKKSVIIVQSLYELTTYEYFNEKMIERIQQNIDKDYVFVPQHNKDFLDSLKKTNQKPLNNEDFITPFGLI